MIARRIPPGSLLLTPDGKQFEFQSGTDHTVSKVERRLRFFLGEYFADTRLGVPWIQQILGKKIPPAVVQSIISQVIRETPGISTVESVSLDLGKDRDLSVSYEATAQDGSFVSENVFIVEA